MTERTYAYAYHCVRCCKVALFANNAPPVAMRPNLYDRHGAPAIHAADARCVLCPLCGGYLAAYNPGSLKPTQPGEDPRAH